jgi:CSLREA domain-containing protein
MLGQARATLFKINRFKLDLPRKIKVGLPRTGFFKSRLFKALAALAVVILGFVAIMVSSALATSYTVNSTGDAADASSTDGVCDTNLATPELECTLRAAIQQANVVASEDEIKFDIPTTDSGRNAQTGVFTITPNSQLPTIAYPVTIDGYSQPGASENTLVEGDNAVLLVEIKGTNVPFSNGLSITGTGSTVKGLVINSFTNSNGIFIDGANATANKIYGNFIGTNTGTNQRLPNLRGVFVQGGASNNDIGGTLPKERNVISGNNDIGVYLSSAGGNRVRSNYIGTGKDGSRPVNPATGAAVDLGNNSDGVFASSSPNTVIGGSGVEAGNVISDNNLNGVEIRDSNNSSVQGNLIGTNAAGTGSLGNNGHGVFTAAPNTLVGGTESGARNVISANGGDGVQVSGTTTGGTRIQGNYIGTDKNGATKLGNTNQGTYLNGVTNVTVGGAEAGAGNVISGNNQNGVWLSGGSANRVQGNIIGLNAAGNTDLGNNFDGVQLNFSTNNLIGGRTAGARNVVSGNGSIGSNGSNGIYIVNASSTGNRVEGNYVGTDVAGTEAKRNEGYGVVVQGASNNTIGGTAAGAGNLVAYNNNDGVSILSSSIANRILSNSIHTNGGLGIDLDSNSNGVTNNDTGDADTGPNNLQNYPVLSKAERWDADGSTTIAGTLNSVSDGAYTVQFFASPSTLSTPYEGQRYLGETSVTTDANGNASFSFTTMESVAAGEAVTATATSTPENDTSEFSQAVIVTEYNDPPVNSVPGAQSTDEDTALVFSGSNKVSVSDPDAGTNSVRVRLQAENGKLTLGGSTGLTFANGDGASNETDTTFTGKISDINTALDGLKFDPAADYYGSASLTITTDDGGNTGSGGAKTDTDTVSITVNPVNDAPTISDIGDQSTDEDTPTSPIAFTIGDKETAAGSLTLTGSSSNTTLVPDANITFGGSGKDRTVTITPGANQSGSATITVIVTDADGDTSSDEFVLTVNETEEKPDAVDDTVTTNQNTPVNVDVLANDSDPDGDSLTISGVSTPGHGTATITDGKVAYTPSAGYAGTDSFTYSISDGNGGTDTAMVNITVKDVTAPSAPRITSPANNSYNNTGDIAFSGTAEPNSTVKLFRIDPFDGPISQGTTQAGADGRWSMEVAGVEDGSYTYAVRATDVANNISPASNSRTVTVDTESPPTPVINKPGNDSYNTTGNVTVSGTAEAGSIVEVFDGNSTESLDEVQVNVYGRWKIWLTEVADGTHSYTVKSTDAAGNTSDDSNTRKVTVDKIRPTVTPTKPLPNATVKAATTTAVEATFSEAMNKASVEQTDSAGKPTTFTLFKGTTQVSARVSYTETTTATGEKVYKATLTPTTGLTAGTYTATITTAAKDLAGNGLAEKKVWTFKAK